jgi:hypothetical protein
MKTTSPRFRIRLRSAAGVILLLWAAGCSSKGSVTGKVFYKDKPLPGGLVLLSHPQLGIVRSRIDADGSYQFASIPPAEVKIAVTGPEAKKGRPLPKGLDWEKLKEAYPGVSDEEIERRMGFQRPGSSSAGPTVALPKKYEDPEQSGLTYAVTDGSQTHDIKLD